MTTTTAVTILAVVGILMVLGVSVGATHRHRPDLQRVLIVVAGLLATLAVTGCAAGSDSSPYAPYAPQNDTHASVQAGKAAEQLRPLSTGHTGQNSRNAPLITASTALITTDGSARSTRSLWSALQSTVTIKLLGGLVLVCFGLLLGSAWTTQALQSRLRRQANERRRLNEEWVAVRAVRQHQSSCPRCAYQLPGP